jgi:phenylalanyl-tRNA synthetase alpha chain
MRKTMSPPSFDALLEGFRADLSTATCIVELEAIGRAHTGKKSALKAAFKSLRDLSIEDRKTAAARLNRAQSQMDAELATAKDGIGALAMKAKIDADWLDLSLPGVAQQRGSEHPVTVIEERCLAVLRAVGFSRVDGPEVEHPYYNFDSLNIPEHHPARDMQDTFWVNGGLLLRSHTTTVQARELQKKPDLPLRIACPGRVYRNEAVDATHLAMFHQLEGLWVEKGLTFAHLKGLLRLVVEKLYGAEREIRFKPKYYPYTEPSIGLDLSCVLCHGKGCEACHGVGWVTILGAGMVHPKVFLEFGYDPDAVSGIAFGLGISRMASQFTGVSKVRSLYESDLRVHQTLRRGAS